MIDRRNTLAGFAVTALAGLAISPSAAWAASGQPALRSGNNYRMSLASGCGDIEALSVTIDVTADIAFSPANAQNGFNFQLNCSSDQARSAWQQYVVGLLGADLHATVQNFRSTGPNVAMISLARQQFPLASLTGMKLPAGARITTALLYDDAKNVNGVDFTVAQRNSTLAHKRVMLSDLGLGTAQTAPVVAFELVLVGPSGGRTVALTSGAGNFTYSAARPLATAASLPSCVAHRNSTAEQANSVYGRLPADPGASFTQTFSVS